MCYTLLLFFYNSMSFLIGFQLSVKLPYLSITCPNLELWQLFDILTSFCEYGRNYCTLLRHANLCSFKVRNGGRDSLSWMMVKLQNYSKKRTRRIRKRLQRVAKLSFINWLINIVLFMYYFKYCFVWFHATRSYIYSVTHKWIYTATKK